MSAERGLARLWSAQLQVWLGLSSLTQVSSRAPAHHRLIFLAQPRVEEEEEMTYHSE